MNQVAYTNKNGSIYLITLVTVAAIVSMVLIGVQLRMATNSQSAIIEQMSEGNTGVLDATEYALQKITDDESWATTAQSGKVFADYALGDSSYSSSVVDAATGLTPTADTTIYRVQVASDHSTVHSAAQIDLLCDKVDYLAVLAAFGATHYWALNETFGTTTAIEQIDSSCDGTYLDPNVTGAGTNTEGGIVPVFAGATDQVQFKRCSDFGSDSQGTVSLWMKLTGTHNTTNYGIFGMLVKKDGKPAINLSVSSTTLIAYIDQWEVFNFANFAKSTSGVITVGQWHHIALSWGPKGLTIYVDGAKVANKSSNTMGIWSFGGSRTPDFNIGSAYTVMDGSQPPAGFEGSIGHFAVLADQLSDSQIIDLAAIKPDLRSTAIVEDSWVRVFE